MSRPCRPVLSLALNARIVKPAITLCVLSLLLTACRHAQPERRSTEAEVRQHIEGQWTLSPKEDNFRFSQVVIAQDGTLTGVDSAGRRELLGTWKLDHHLLVLDTVKTNYAVVNHGRRVSLGTVMRYPVIFASEHELVLAPGITEAGRYRFTR